MSNHCLKTRPSTSQGLGQFVNSKVPIDSSKQCCWLSWHCSQMFSATHWHAQIDFTDFTQQMLCAVSLSCPLLFVMSPCCAVWNRHWVSLQMFHEVNGDADPVTQARKRQSHGKSWDWAPLLSSYQVPWHPTTSHGHGLFDFLNGHFQVGSFQSFQVFGPRLCTTDQVVSVGQVVARQWTILRDNAQQKVLLIKGPTAQGPEMGNYLKWSQSRGLHRD